MSYFKSQLIACFLLGQLQIPVALAKSDTTTLAAPIVATPSEDWEGNDGKWSTFEIRVGNPQQNARVLPATSWQETWVIWAESEDCDTFRGIPSNCGDLRGGAFNNATSSTFQVTGEFGLGLNTDLGYSGVAEYGFDTVGLGYTNSTGPTLPHQIVAAIHSETWWFGILGIGFQPTNFTGFGEPQASFADTLVTNGSISSMSWSYTAGAYYRLKSVFGSLIFGGYDASRFTPNNLTFDMTEDNERDIVLSLQTITSTTSSGNITLMSTPELMFIDSSVPELWLPLDVCEEFENAFGIELDSSTDRYLLNTSTHSSLLAQNPTFTFTLANDPITSATVNASNTIDITLPYASFDLNVSAPIVLDGTSFYFPIRRAQNSTQYTIGRTFLQESYVTADYNTRTFNVSQCVFENGVDADVIAIPSTTPTSSSTTSTSSPNSSTTSHKTELSSGAIAGIAIAAALILLLSLVIFFLRRRHQQKRKLNSRGSHLTIGNPKPIHEIDPGTRVERDSDGKWSNLTAYNKQASKLASELHGNAAKAEIGGNPIMHPQELDAGVVPGVFFEKASDVESEGHDIDADNPESSAEASDIGGLGVRKNASGRSKNAESSGEESGDRNTDSGISSLSPLSPTSPSPQGGLRPAPAQASRDSSERSRNFSTTTQLGLSPSPEVSTDSENGNAAGSETDHLVSPMTDRASEAGREMRGTWGSNVVGFRVSSPVSEES